MGDGRARLYELFQLFLTFFPTFLSGAYDENVASCGKCWRFHVSIAVHT